MFMPGIPELEAWGVGEGRPGGSRVSHQPWLHIEWEASLSYGTLPQTIKNP